MSYPDLPPMVKAMLANERHRTHHHLWHFVRNKDSWNELPDAARQQLTAEGWAAPRFDQEPDSGIDFLGMHREMIEMTNRALGNAGVSEWPSVVGWDPIPWEDDDEDWPVPAWQTAAPPWATEEQWSTFSDLAINARSQSQVDEMRRVAAIFRDPERLSAMTLDELGISMEWSIHGWMHMRWSGAPHDDGFSADPDNDWLFVPWSSHVNKVFWKLHGWIDERIDDWESATGQTADLSRAWSGPPSPQPGMPHMANKELLNNLPAREDKPMPMMVRQHIVEGLLK